MSAIAPKTPRYAGSESLAARLEHERERLFVGRQAELARFRRVLEGRSATCVVVVSGPAGIGKSLLAERLMGMARRQAVHTVALDAHLLHEVTPEVLEASITDRVSAFDQSATMNVLCIDNIECIAAMEDWLRQQLFSLVPANTVVLLVGRWQPPAAWRADPALSSFFEHWPLEPLSVEAVQVYLQRRGLTPEQRYSAVQFAHGHPLAVALAADHLMRTGKHRLQPDKSGALIQSLVDWLLSDIRNTEYRQCLEAAATLQFVREPALQTMLPRVDAATMYQWLASQPYMQHRGRGLSMHETVRTVIIEDLRRRNRPRHHRLIRRAVDHFLANLEQLDAGSLHQALTEASFTLRWESYMRRFYDFTNPLTHYLDKAGADERDVLARIVGQEEGADAREWFLYWWDRQPAVLQAVRDDTGQSVGVLLALVFDQSDLNAGHSDPAVRRYLDDLKRHGRLENGEKALLMRFSMIAGTYQQTGPAFTQVATRFNGLMFVPGLTHIACVCDDAKDWESTTDYTNFKALPDGVFHTQRRRLQIRGVDLKAEPPVVVLRNIATRVLSPSDDEQDLSADATALTRDEFADAVLNAMRDFNNDQALMTNPLLRSPMLRQYCQNAHPTAEDLRRLIQQTAKSLDREYPHKHLSFAFEYRYIHRARKQLAGAGTLKISERTFRRRLRQVEREIIERLWARTSSGVRDAL